MHDPLGNHESLPARQLDRPVAKVDEELAVEDEKEFVFVVMLMPVVFALQYAETGDRAVDLAQRLVVPAIGACLDQLRNVDNGQRREFDIEVGRV